MLCFLKKILVLFSCLFYLCCSFICCGCFAFFLVSLLLLFVFLCCWLLFSLWWVCLVLWMCPVLVGRDITSWVYPWKHEPYEDRRWVTICHVTFSTSILKFRARCALLKWNWRRFKRVGSGVVDFIPLSRYFHLLATLMWLTSSINLSPGVSCPFARSDGFQDLPQ